MKNMKAKVLLVAGASLFASGVLCASLLPKPRW